eukprot:1853445-Lingulodinium_polyedra.AAC.1
MRAFLRHPLEDQLHEQYGHVTVAHEVPNLILVKRALPQRPQLVEDQQHGMLPGADPAGGRGPRGQDG